MKYTFGCKVLKILYKIENNINGSGEGLERYGNSIIKFEGEYLNGKRNGKGKKFYMINKISFEGEYLNDLKWNGKGYDIFHRVIYELKNGKGFVKKYWEHKPIDFILKFEGEYLYGKKNGKGKEYYENGNIEYEGDYLNGKRSGNGKENYKDGTLRFEGEYLYGFKLKGKLYLKEKLEYEGEFLYNKKWNGKGYDENGNIIYELINGNGYVKEYYDEGKLKFEGQYLNGKKTGKGKEYNSYNYKLEFEGEYLDGKRNGKGKEYWNDILKFEGEYLNGKKIE